MSSTVILPFLVVKGSFQGMAGLLTFVLIRRPGLAQQHKRRKHHCHQHFIGLFLRLTVATPQLAGIKNGNFAISPLLLLASANTHRNIYFFETIRKLHRNIFLQIRMMTFNPSLLLTNLRSPYTN